MRSRREGLTPHCCWEAQSPPQISQVLGSFFSPGPPASGCWLPLQNAPPVGKKNNKNWLSSRFFRQGHLPLSLSCCHTLPWVHLGISRPTSVLSRTKPFPLHRVCPPQRSGLRWKEMSSAVGISEYMQAHHPRGQLEWRATDHWLQGGQGEAERTKSHGSEPNAGLWARVWPGRIVGALVGVFPLGVWYNQEGKQMETKKTRRLFSGQPRPYVLWRGLEQTPLIRGGVKQ